MNAWLSDYMPFLIVMSVSYMKTFPIPIFSEWNFCPCYKCSRMVYCNIRLDKGNIAILIRIILAELIHIIAFWTFSMVESLVKIPTSNAMLSPISSLNANVIFAEIF